LVAWRKGKHGSDAREVGMDKKGRQEDTSGELIWRNMWEVWCKDKEEVREMKRKKGRYSHVG